MKNLNVRELLDLAVGEADTDAMVELLERQNNNRTRLWPNPRKGPDDEGWTICTQTIEGDVPCWNTSPHAYKNGMVFDHNAAKKWIMSSVANTIRCMGARCKDGDDTREAVMQIEELSDGIDGWSAFAGTGEDGYALIVINDESMIKWRPGMFGMAKFCSDLIVAIETGQPGELTFTNEEWKVVWPFMPVGMFPAPPTAGVVASQDALSDAMKKRKGKVWQDALKKKKGKGS